MSSEKRYTAVARVVSIDTTKKDLSDDNSYRNTAFVEFTDYKGQPAKGSFTLPKSPLYTKIRVNSQVEIEYDDSIIPGGYTVFLLNPELYERIPTEEELAPYRRNSKRVLKQSLMGIAALFIAAVLYGITKSFLVIAAMVVVTYFIMKYGSEQEKADSDKFLSWYDEE